MSQMYSSHVQTAEYRVLFVPQYDGDDAWVTVEDARRLIKARGGPEAVAKFDAEGTVTTYDGWWSLSQRKEA